MDRLSPFWKGALGAVVVFVVTALVVLAGLTVMWAHNGQQAYVFLLNQLQKQQQLQTQKTTPEP